MTEALNRLGIVLPKLRAVFQNLQRIENDPDIEWAELLDQREKADPLSDDSFHRGYLVGVADALGIPIPDIINAIRTKPRRRIIKSKGQS